jgi:hypothetical protein
MRLTQVKVRRIRQPLFGTSRFGQAFQPLMKSTWAVLPMVTPIR